MFDQTWFIMQFFSIFQKHQTIKWFGVYSALNLLSVGYFIIFNISWSNSDEIMRLRLCCHHFVNYIKFSFYEFLIRRIVPFFLIYLALFINIKISNVNTDKAGEIYNLRILLPGLHIVKKI